MIGEETAGEQLTALVAGLSIEAPTVLVCGGADGLGVRTPELFRLIDLAESNEAPCPHARAEAAPAPRRGSLREGIEIIAACGIERPRAS